MRIGKGVTPEQRLLALAGLGGLLSAAMVVAPTSLLWALGGLSLLVWGLLLYLLVRHSRFARSARHYLDLLRQLDHHDLLEDVHQQKLPPPPAGSPYGELLTEVRMRMSELSSKIGEAEQDRAGAEVRARRLATEREQISEILTNFSDPVLAIDNYDELVLSNPSAQQLFDLDNRSTEDRALKSLVSCQELVELLTETRRRKNSAQRTGEIEFVDERGQQHWFRVSCRSLNSAGAGDDQPSSAQGAVAVLRDIGGQKAIQKRNAEFVSAVSHEMKTPLAGIKAYVELLADGDADDRETQEEFLEVINSQADRLQRLIDNLLNLARIEAGVVNVNKQDCSLNDLLEEAASVVQPAAEQKKIRLITELSPMYLGVYVDRDMLAQAAINLLSNAIKYTPDEGQVTLRSRMDDSEIALEVIDTGVGLDEEDRQRVFDKFYRVKKDHQMAPGTGLGLPLAKHIVEDVHGGRLEVDSEPGQGSTFRILLRPVHA